MPWPSNGDYYVFKEEAINAKAPPVSGVYGLYTRKHYVLIGESADIRKALLRHEKQTSFRFGLYRPVGFTFEVCSAELRAQRAQELIEEYRPVLQPRAPSAFPRLWRPWKNRAVSPAAVTNTTQHEDQPDPIAANQKTKEKLFSFSGDQLLVVALAFAVTAVSIGLLGVLTEEKVDPKRVVKNEESPLKIPAAPQLEALGSSPGARAEGGLSSDNTLTDVPDRQPLGEEPPNETKTQQQTVKSETTKPNSVGKETDTTTAQRPSETDGDTSASLAALQKERQFSHAAQRESPGLGKRWTVQVKAYPDKSLADVWADMLKTKGYDAFIVEADIKGKIWYRVRVGHFDNRREAETMRNILDSQEGFSDAFLAGNKIGYPPGPKG